MKKLLITTALVTLGGIGQPVQHHDSHPIAFIHVTVIDTTGGRSKPEMTVVVTGDRISDAGPFDKVRIPKDSTVIDARGKFLIPGLWDMHVHWYLKEYLPLFTANGVTGIRLMWGTPAHHQWRKEIENGTQVGPRLVIASRIIDGPRPVWPGSIAVSNEAEAREAVRRSKRDGADFLKVYSLLPRDAYFAIADEAKREGLTFAGHVPQRVSAAEASDAGQKSIEHLTGILGACSSREQDLLKMIEEIFSGLPPNQNLPGPARTRPLTRLMLDSFSPDKAAALFARLKRNHTWQCPTLTVLRSTAFIDDPNARKDPRLKYTPPQVRNNWDPANDFRFRQRTAQDFDLAKQVYRKQLELVGMMRRAGVEFIAGTDTLNPYCFPGFSLHDELALLVEAGFTPLEALEAATSNAARFLGREKDLGTIEKGKMADMVLLDGDPLQDIRNSKTINSVIAAGKLFRKQQIDEMLANAERAAARN